MEEEKKTGFWAEFRKFISRGSVMDMAVGVIIGAAFKAIIDSLVNDIVMPLIGILVKTDSFASLSVTVGGAVIAYGKFIAAIINFLLMALVIFTIVRAINKTHEMLESLKKKPEEEPAPEEPPAPTEAELLTEIVALLKEKKGA